MDYVRVKLIFVVNYEFNVVLGYVVFVATSVYCEGVRFEAK